MAQFQSFWRGESLPRHVVLSIKSFLDHGHSYQLYAYTHFEIPAPARLLDASQILPETQVFFYSEPDGSRGSVAAFANRFRYELLRAQGNWWVDTDVVCLSEYVPTGESFWGWESSEFICQAILKVPPGHQLVEVAAREACRAGTELTWGQTGPVLFTRLVRELRLEALTSPQSQAYPISWREHLLPATTAGLVESRERLAGRPFLHLWQEMFRRSGDVRIDRPEEGSFLDELYRCYALS